MPSLSSRLTRAIQRKDIGEVTMLLQAGADVNKPVDGFPPLHTAAIVGHTGIVNLLLENKADIFAVNDISGTALTLAAINGHTHIIDLLVAHGLHPDHFGKNTHSHPLIQSVTLSSEKISLHLLKAGASTDIFSADGVPLICLAAKYDQLTLLQTCIKKAPQDMINAALHHATKARRYNAVKFLLDAGADANCINDNIVPLHHLCDGRPQNLMIARLLLDKGADPDFGTPKILSAYELITAIMPVQTHEAENVLRMRELFLIFREHRIDCARRKEEKKQYMIDMAHKGVPHKIRMLPKIKTPKR